MREVVLNALDSAAGDIDDRRLERDLGALDEWADRILFDTLVSDAGFSSSIRRSLDESARSLSAHPRHHWVLRRWLEALTARGALVFDPRSQTWTVGEPLPPPEEAETHVTPGPICGEALWTFYRDCARQLPSMLRDETTIQPLLFGTAGIVDEIYRTNAASRATNAAAAAAVRQLAPSRVMELGAGTGATTSAVLDAVPGGAEYLFTDVSPYFFDTAESLSDRVRVQTRIFDINRPDALPPQDAVVAGNVLHNAWDIDDAAAMCLDLVADGGHVVMIETGREHHALLLSMVFLMSPQPGGDGPRFHDQRRHDGRMLLRADEWERAFERAGGELVVRAPSDGHPLSPTAQFVLVVRRTTRKVRTS